MLNTVVDRVKSLTEDLIRDKRALIKILSIVIILILALIFKTHETVNNDITVEATSGNSEATEISEDAADYDEVCVDIGGAVKNPGVYKVKNGTRLYEVIALAGGLRSDADTDSVNQASYVEDGAKIIIPIYSETSNAIQSPEQSSQIVNDIVTGSSGITDSSLVNINTADKDQLKTLSGIGDVIADRIIEYRSEARFNAKEDIMSVKGIGSAIYDKIKDRIVI